MKSLLIACFSIDGIVYQKYFVQRQTVNQHHYIDILWEGTWQRQCAKWHTGVGLSGTAMLLLTLAINHVTVVPYPLYSHI